MTDEYSHCTDLDWIYILEPIQKVIDLPDVDAGIEVYVISLDIVSCSCFGFTSKDTDARIDLNR